jgi:hypothetical protein
MRPASIKPVRTVGRPLPVYPCRLNRSTKVPIPDSCAAPKDGLIDHLVGKNQQLLRDSQPQDMCRLATNDQIEPCQTLVQAVRSTKDQMPTYQFVGSRQVLQCVGQIKTGSSAHTLYQTPDFRRHGKPHGIMPVLSTSPTSKSQSSGASWIGSHLLDIKSPRTSLRA